MAKRPRPKSRRPSTTAPASTKRPTGETLARARAELRRHRERLAEATAQQAATVAILHAIASVRTDYQPVFDTIVRHAVGVCGAYDAFLMLVDADELALRAHHGPLEALPRQPLSADTVAGRTVLDAGPVHVENLAEAVDFPLGRDFARRLGIGAALGVPLLRDGQALGAIMIRRAEAQPFTDTQIALLQTFADQAVIAIENVRLFREVQASNRGLSDALEQQTATGEILRVISSSPTDVQPVFDSLVVSAAKLAAASDVILLLREREQLRPVAGVGAFWETLSPEFRVPLVRSSIAARSVIDGAAQHVEDLETLPEDEFAAGRALQRRFGHHTVLAVPLLRESVGIGTIFALRFEVQPFADQQIALLRTFADQAVIAIENVRLFTELEQRNAGLTEAHAQITEALEQQTATAEILRAISGSPTDIQPVLNRMAESAVRFCQAYDAIIFRVDGDQLLRVAHHGPISTLPLGVGIPITPGGVATRAVLEERPIHVPDIRLVEADYPEAAANARILGNRTIVAVPLLRDGIALGAIALRRIEPSPFTDKQIQLLTIFADQAVIAIENVRLFTELQASNRDLTEALDQQTATSEILRVISSSPTDVQPVFESLVISAARLCNASDLQFVVREGDALRPVAGVGRIWDERTPELRVPLVRSSVLARAVLDGTTQHVADVAALPEAEFPVARALQRQAGHRTMLAVPLLRDGMALGGIFATRLEVRPFTDQQVALLRTFADQAVIAIENVRLFTELERRNAALTEAHVQITEALEQQTATAEILRVISSSPTDIQPVLDRMAESAARFCQAYDATIFRVDGVELRLVAHHGPISSLPLGAGIPITPGGVATRAVLEARPIHVPDIRLVEAEYPVAATNARNLGNRTMLAVPLLREGVALGAILLRRIEPDPFTDKQIALLGSFADQAVIAIENVRLFTELQASNRELTTALDTQTATSDILRVISRSQTDVQPVFDAIVASAVRLLRARSGTLSRVVDDRIELASHTSTDATGDAATRAAFPQALTFTGMHAQTVRNRTPLNIADAQSDPRLPEASHTYARRRGFRSQVGVPMLRHDQAIGAIAVSRVEPGGFTEDEIVLLRTFADQAVIAIENARLLTELQARTTELTRSVDELRALGEVGQAVSSTLDLDAVLTTVVARAVELSGADGGSVYEYDAAAEEFVFRAAHHVDDPGVALRREIRLRKGEGATGRLAVTRAPIQLADIAAEGTYDSRLREALLRTGARAVLAVPLLREEHLIGGLVVSRNTPGEFPPEIVNLLQTFATQSALAMQNARLFREIEIKSRQLEVASQHKSEFLASMSHELRTPLNAVIGFSDVLLQGMFGETNEKQTEYLRDILASGQHLLSLINDILDLSKIEAGRMDLDLADFDLPSAIDDALLLMRERAARRGIVLERRVDARLGPFRADQRKVKQVLLNLLSNAVKFTPEGGRIDVRAAPMSDAVEISVTDTGIGIAPGDHEAVFEEFRQVGQADRKAEGTGLGLALCRKFVELHGGRIWVKSEPGAGSTFTFSLPWPETA